MTENAGFKEVNKFFTKADPNSPMPQHVQQLDQLQQELQKLQQENQSLKADKGLEFEKVNVDKFNAETNRIKAVQPPQPATNITMNPNGIKTDEGEEEVSRIDMLEQALMQIMQQQNAPKTKTTRMVKVGEGEYVAETVENGAD